MRLLAIHFFGNFWGCKPKARRGVELLTTEGGVRGPYTGEPSNVTSRRMDCLPQHCWWPRVLSVWSQRRRPDLYAISSVAFNHTQCNIDSLHIWPNLLEDGEWTQCCLHLSSAFNFQEIKQRKCFGAACQLKQQHLFCAVTLTLLYSCIQQITLVLQNLSKRRDENTDVWLVHEDVRHNDTF